MAIFKDNSNLSHRLLITYMISSLLFLLSTNLHIHSKETLITSDHGAAVSISSLVNDVIQADMGDQIKVNPDAMLKEKPTVIQILAVFMLVAMLALCTPDICVKRLQITRGRHPDTPYYCMPLLRAPPQ